MKKNCGENVKQIKGYVCKELCECPTKYSGEDLQKVCHLTCNLELMLEALLPPDVKDMTRGRIHQMLNELVAIDEMDYISQETRVKARQEILRNIEAYEKGWKSREYSIVKGI